jgi:hypothetical protein
MTIGRLVALVGLCGGAVLTACGTAGDVPPANNAPVAEQTPAPAAAPAASATAQTALQCTPSPRMALAGRASPYDSTMVPLGGTQAKICYGRPAAKGRTMIGGENVPYGKLWRTGANEPTIIHLPVAAEIAGIAVEPGSYSLYTVPGETEWEVIVNRSTSQWGHEGQYTDAIRAQEVGRAKVPSERMEPSVESFTIRSQPAAGGRTDVLLEWENTRVRIPVAPRA